MASTPDRLSRPHVALAALLAVYTLSFIDRQLVAILAEPIRRDLGLSDTELGLLTGFAFAIFYTAFGVPVARLADRHGRVRVIALSCAAWSLFTGATALVTSFWQMALARVGVAVGEAGGSPPSFSLIADYFPAERRATATAIYTLGTPIGLFLGAAAGGWIAATWDWRTAFVVAAIPGLLMAPLLPLLVREPRRAVAADAPPVTPVAVVLGDFVRRPELRLLALAAGVSAMVGWAVLNWAPAWLMRVHGMSLKDVATWFSPAIAAGMGVGILLSGIATDRLARRSPRWNAWVPAAAFGLAGPLFALALAAPSWPWAVVLLALPCGLFMSYVAPTFAVLQSLVPADSRSTASAVMLFTMNIIGMGGGPLLVGVLSDRFAAAGPAGLTQAMTWLIPLFVLAAALHLLVARALPKR
ncbi:spinster family MFS transporter [Sandaracinobacteroides saxicola]|uniref:MFS transporter n=1 Tax=Sandaracinobacteroides saxicola TaxID=2759707 RepID=A0A7G5ILF1_9SPHN|nr:MFS transporter [Sandaracinobacteroides saxicola]QMW24193.1 MFS transporter [Sandaracinobacteroides saxicola]